MTLYQGETVRIATYATLYDGVTRLTDLDVEDASITLFDSSLTELFEAPMSWDSTNSEWYYDWNTSAVEAGGYRAKCLLQGAAFKSFEFKRVRLARPPV